MSIHDFSPLLAAPHSDHHFASSFFHHHHPHHHSTSTTTTTSSSAHPYDRAAFLAAPPYLRSASAYHSSPYDYTPQHHYQHQSQLHFDPRPPHAGWTPKEEIDDDAQTRELLSAPVQSRSPHHHPSLSPISAPSPPSTSPPTTSKTYSFVSLPGNAVRKRPRRRYDEIERLYACAWPDCPKAYGTLNHLNAHVSMQRHGPKRSPVEFKELRKQWRQQKKQETSSSSSESSTASIASIVAAAAPRAGRRTTTTTTTLAPHRLSLGDLQTFSSAEEGPSPTSSAGWTEAESPMGRLPPDSTLLSGYSPHGGYAQVGEVLVHGGHSPTHVHGHSPTHVHGHSSTHVHGHSPTHVHGHSPTHVHGHSPTHINGHSSTHVSPTLVHGHSPTHVHGHSPTSVHGHSPAHVHGHSPTHINGHSPTLVHGHSSTQINGHSPTLVHGHSPPQVSGHSPSHQGHSPSQVSPSHHGHSPTQVHSHSASTQIHGHARGHGYGGSPPMLPLTGQPVGGSPSDEYDEYEEGRV